METALSVKHPERVFSGLRMGNHFRSQIEGHADLVTEGSDRAPLLVDDADSELGPRTMGAMRQVLEQSCCGTTVGLIINVAGRH